MSANTSRELGRRRKELAESLPALSQKRTDTYRLNSDALALDRAGVKNLAPQEMVRLGENEGAADAAIRDAQLELRNLDAQIQSVSGLGARFGRAARRVRRG
jgi:hypothetical protein